MKPLPITIPVETITLEQIAGALAGEPGFACIDARNVAGPAGRFSIAVAYPAHTFSIAGGFVTVDGHTAIDTPSVALARFCAPVAEWAFDPYLPFSGGMVGYIGYEGARAIRGLAPASGFSRHSQCRLGLYPAAAIFDHVEGTAFVIAGGSDRRDAMAAAELLIERIEGTRGARPAAASPAESAGPLQLTPGNASFRQLVDAAHSWIRAGSAVRLHVVRHAAQPQAEVAPLGLFFARERVARARALFTYEGASYVVRAGGTYLSIDGDRVTSSVPLPEGICTEGRLAHELAKIDALIAMLPSETVTGAPYDRALDFIERHEEAHRSLYGGAFGTMDARRLTFQVIDHARVIADGTIATIVGADVTERADVQGLSQELESMLSLS
jgi:anthranilate/para-aminobenzoate synthase component I